MSEAPLDGLRILDLSYFWGGPYCTSYLGAMGAEVIKVESIQRPDTFRFGTSVTDSWWELFGVWNFANVNKYGITLDLGNPRGVDLFKKLLKVSDVVVENFTPRVMGNFGLAYPALKEIKSDIIMVSMPGFGLTGPWRDYVSFGFGFEQVAGLAYLTGYPDGAPEVLGAAADPIAGMHAAFAILAALEYRRRTGQGQLIDVSQTEANCAFVGPAVVDYSVNKKIWGRMGNRDPSMAPHGVYRCKGNDTWLSIAVSSDNEWNALCQAIGQEPLAQDERFEALSNRWQNQDILDKIIEKWTQEHDRYDAMAILQKAGVPAGVLTTPDKLYEDPQLRERGFYQELTRDLVGTHLYPKWPMKFSQTPQRMRPAPKLGENNSYVFETILGLSKSDIEELERTQVIGTVPLGSHFVGM